ncbi:hypothetical protein [Pectobacterium phage Wc4-1]|uniref:Uncharacterized protein n=1 Tax=Pectobacterium phage Wc4 TaxID=2652428 RepID=A0A5P8D449_9CAUD|nr:hypothetical protein [Pectobacterium phage Wc4]QFP93940.1 hypothetical protein [Pectobacterium phage Wc4-1]
MTREDARKTMMKCWKMTHKTFTPDEWLEIRAHGEIYTEDGYIFTNEFHNRSMFADGWSIYRG